LFSLCKLQKRVYEILNLNPTQGVRKTCRGNSRNLINRKIYIGSSVDLRLRLRNYFSVGYLKRKTSIFNSKIYSSLLKNGYGNFRLEILKYCSPDECIKWEQFYVDLLNPEYNILRKAGSSLGYKHSVESRANISAFHMGRKRSLEDKANISASLMGNSNGKNQPSSLKIQVTDIELNSKTIFPSIKAAARSLNIRQSSISNYLASNPTNPFKKRYLFKKID
jgi:group I intron endonuclease